MGELRNADVSDISAVQALWRQNADAGEADSAWHADAISQDVARCQVLVDENQRVMAAALTQDVPTIEGLTRRLEPVVALDIDAQIEFLDAVADRLPADRYIAVHAWLVGARAREVETAGFSLERTFARLDRPGLDDLFPRKLEPPYRLVPLSSSEADLDRLTAMYNKAFEGEYQHWPDSGATLRQVAHFNADSCLAALHGSGQSVGLVLTHLMQRDDSRRQPIGHLMVVCVDRNHRRQQLAENLSINALALLRQRGARSATVRTDLGSEHRSVELYKKLGFEEVLRLQGWRRSLK